jgi:hypothetical protein
MLRGGKMKNTSKFSFIVFLIGASLLAACGQAGASTVEPGTLAATTTLNVIPSKGIVISVMTNMAGSPVDLVVPISQELVSILQK